MSSSSCAVCTGPSNGICHYGVECCRACASFFHRSLKEKRRYTCRWAQKCEIVNDEGLRNSCRACRLKKCLAVGMAEEKKRDRKGHKKLKKIQSDVGPSSNQSQQISTTFELQDSPTTTSASMATMPLEQIRVPQTVRFDESLRQYENGLKALAVVEGISTDFRIARGEARVITLDEYLHVGKGSALLVYSLICQHLPLLRDLPTADRIRLLKAFSKQFILLFRIRMSCRAFPNLGEPGCTFAVIVPGGLVDISRIEQDFGGNAESGQRVRISVTKRHYEFGVKHFHPMKVTQLEFAAMCAILFWNTVDQCLPLAMPAREIQAQRDALYVELFSVVSERCAENKEMLAPVRFAHLLEFLHLLGLHTMEVEEMLTMGKIFMDLSDFFDEINLPS